SRTADIGWYADEEKGRVYFVQLQNSIPSGKHVEISAPKKMMSDKQNTISLEMIGSEKEGSFHAYGRGRLQGTYDHFSDAAQAAYETMGFVTIGQHEPIWIRANRPGAYFMRDIQGNFRDMEEKRESLLGVLAQDPRPSYQKDPERVYGVSFGSQNIRFQVQENILTVIAVDTVSLGKQG
ncbi:MAG: hypothetical protein IIV70_07600, partial [Peptococcaceae bacterium]|nr:hypothetical protein [Peptococcaceae bacterium]